MKRGQRIRGRNKRKGIKLERSKTPDRTENEANKRKSRNIYIKLR